MLAFINGQQRHDDLPGFEGGEFRLYRLEEKPTWDNFCLTVVPEAGMLLAFESSGTICLIR